MSPDFIGANRETNNPIPQAYEAGEKVKLLHPLTLTKRSTKVEFPAGSTGTVVQQPKKDKVVVNFRGYLGVEESKTD